MVKHQVIHLLKVLEKKKTLKKMSKTTNFKFSKQLLPIDIGVEKKGT